MSLLLSRRDLDFLLFEWLQVERLLERPRFVDHSRETFDAVLRLSEQIATEHFAPHNKVGDANEPRFDGERVFTTPEAKAALAVFAKADLVGASMDAEVGGQQLPRAVSVACFAWFQAANVATSAYPFLTVGAANLLTAYGSPEQVRTWVPPMVEGRFFGTMCLSETQAGSSLADITTRAEPRDDGSHRLNGSKMWISAGDHDLSENIVHLVLAKIPGSPAGVRGISLFLVPKYLLDAAGEPAERNDVTVAGLNHKMGYRGTTNAVLSFGDGTHRPLGRPGAVGFLIGRPNQGLSAMFHMMNEARIGVGTGATALGYTGYLKALDYARSRPQGRPVTAKDPSSPQVPIIEHPDVRRMLLAQKSYVEGALGLVLYCGRLLDEQQTAPSAEDVARAGLLLELLTPIAKSWPSQWCLEANNLAIQVHGGYGYTRDYDVEQHYRDNRLNPIHEGTHGIQGLDLLGRKVVMNGGAGLTALTGVIGDTIERAAGAGAEPARLGGLLRDRVDRLTSVTSTLWAGGDPAVALANSSVYLEAFGHIVLAWIWLEQLLATQGRRGAFYDGKRQAARFFFSYELPRVGPQLDLLESLDRTTLDMPAGWF
jgi:alkylation response protein AidB-like acyl-CoA dehydrogenase